MIHIRPFEYEPTDEERERASNSYVMSLVAVMVGMPLPIVNLLATLAFYLAQRHSTRFIRWHCTQALLSQVSLLVMNSVGFIWTMRVIFDFQDVSNYYIAYMITIGLYNLGELIATIYSAIKVRDGVHIEWMLYGTLTNEILE